MSRPTLRGPKPNLFNAQMAKIDSRMACEKVTNRAAVAMNRSERTGQAGVNVSLACFDASLVSRRAAS